MLLFAMFYFCFKGPFFRSTLWVMIWHFASLRYEIFVWCKCPKGSFPWLVSLSIIVHFFAISELDTFGIHIMMTLQKTIVAASDPDATTEQADIYSVMTSGAFRFELESDLLCIYYYVGWICIKGSLLLLTANWNVLLGNLLKIKFLSKNFLHPRRFWLFPSDDHDGFGQIIFGIQIHPTMAKKMPPAVIFKGDTTTITHLGEKSSPDLTEREEAEATICCLMPPSKYQLLPLPKSAIDRLQKVGKKEKIAQMKSLVTAWHLFSQCEKEKKPNKKEASKLILGGKMQT